MSAFLGPIHEQMYAKILQTDARGDRLAALAGTTLPPGAERRPLAQVVDHSDIHGWLTEAVTRAEVRFAKAVRAAADAVPEAELIDRMREMGSEESVGRQDLPEAPLMHRALHAVLLDGMPCDFPFALGIRAPETMTWTLQTDPHAAAFRAEGLDPELFYRLRDGWVDGYLADSIYTYTRDGAAYRLTKGA